ncbi:hypothetical protein [Embleya sp. NPDC050493]
MGTVHAAAGQLNRRTERLIDGLLGLALGERGSPTPPGSPPPPTTMAASP